MTEVASHRGSCGGGPVLPVVPRRLRRHPASHQAPRTLGVRGLLGAGALPIGPAMGGECASNGTRKNFALYGKR